MYIGCTNVTDDRQTTDGITMTVGEPTNNKNLAIAKNGGVLHVIENFAAYLSLAD